MPDAAPIDPVALSQALIRCPSVTPEDAGVLDVLSAALESLGFACHRLPFEGDGSWPVVNLYARRGDKAPNFCFAGHTDVVPVGNEDEWTVDPFAAEIRDDRLWGRGASDMKTAIAAFVAAVARGLAARPEGFPGSVSLLISGDEEGEFVNGTPKVLAWLKERGEVLDHCLVGEPTNPRRIGDMVKIGRRGSMNAELMVFGTSGHAAYPENADNPVERLLKMLAAVVDQPLDEGSAHFPATRAVVTTVDVGNPTTNVIPERAYARLNIRFNDRHTGKSMERLLRQRFDGVGGEYELKINLSGESFLTPPGRLSDVVSAAVEKVTGLKPDLNTAGGTSDARFIKDHCPVCEFGMTNLTAHKADENAPLADIRMLTDIYAAVLDGYFADAAG